MILPKKLLLRSRFIVDRGLQFNLVTRMVIFVLFTFAILSALLFSPLTRDVKKAAAEGRATQESVETLLMLHSRLWPVGILCLAVAVAAAVFVSHRMAGPLVRVKRIMRFVTEGHLPRPLNTRPRDYFKDEVNVLNAMVDSLANRVESLKRTHAELESSIDEYAKLTGVSFDRDIRRAFAQLREHSQALGTTLDEFSSQTAIRPEELDADNLGTEAPTGDEPRPAATLSSGDSPAGVDAKRGVD